MTKKILLALAALTALTLCFSSCKKDNKGNNPTPTDVKLAVSPDNLTVMIGKTAALEIKTKPANAEYTCISKDPAIATVDKKGVITGVAEGKTTVTVTAGTATKDVTVKVIPLADLKDDMYIGLYDNGLEKKIPAIYMPYKAADLTKAKQQEIIYAMTSKGWEFTHYKNDPNSDMAFLFQAPEEKAQDWQMKGFAYYHNPKKGNKFCVGTQSAWKGIDPLAPEDKLDANGKEINKLIRTVAKAYGFTEDYSSGTLKDGSNAFSAYNLSRGKDQPLELLAYSDKVDDPKDGIVYIVSFQITCRGPKAPSSLATRTAIRPVLDENVDLSMLLRKNK
ncbi:Ig-like domain-containing protein [Porphyromonas uenonis]|uniref:Ig-like domain-containing protein n=1 Tax=Porphyromonas uenonis TaxID=281920 RepID=UPI00046E7ACC|nr:Ig-like domain-containing protein [Porphyromonas uenonis]